jgi:lysophospholipase L1-like esterase
MMKPIVKPFRGPGRGLGWTGLVTAFAVLASSDPVIAAEADVKRSGPQWIGTWATAPQPFMPRALETFRNQSLRLIVHTSVGGRKVRIKISNTFGDHPLVIGAAHIARRSTGAEIDPTSDRPLTFRGHSKVTVAAGSMVVSDPVELDVPGLSDLAVSLFLPQTTRATTSHLLALQTSYVSPETGDSTAAVKFPVARTTDSWPFLTGVDVEASARGVAIVAFGSSLTDGDGSTQDANRRWPDVLAERLLQGAARSTEVGVLNQGLIGNRLLKDSPQDAGLPFGAALGEAGLKRFERDVLAQAGVRYVIQCLGINDVTFPGSFTPATERVGAESMIAGYQALIARAHDKGIRVIGTTLPPFENASFPAPAVTSYTPEKEAVRQEINAWIRDSGAFDAIIDFDLVLRDPSHPTRLLPAYDSGDHMHPNDAGNVASGNAIPLAMFEDR